MRYLVFEFDQYYPGGGMDDCTLKTDSEALAVAKATQSNRDWRQVYDTQTGIVTQYTQRYTV